MTLEEYLKKERDCPIKNCRFNNDYTNVLQHIQDFHQIKVVKMLEAVNKEQKITKQISIKWK